MEITLLGCHTLRPVSYMEFPNLLINADALKRAGYCARWTQFQSDHDYP